MYVDYHIGQNNEKSIDIILEGIYYLRADKSYIVDHPPFKKNHYILVYTLSGSGFLMFDGHEFSVNAFDVLLISPEKSLNYRCIQDNWSFWWFEFYSETTLISLNTKFNVPQDNLIMDLCNRVLIYYKQNQNTDASTLFSSILSIFRTEIMLRSITDDNIKRFNELDIYIRKNISTVTVVSLAKILSVDERTLRNIFYKYAGVSPYKYISNVRLDIAKYFIKNTDKSIYEIAINMGYSSQFHFSKVFKKRFSIPPKIYRKNQ